MILSVVGGGVFISMKGVYEADSNCNQQCGCSMVEGLFWCHSSNKCSTSNMPLHVKWKICHYKCGISDYPLNRNTKNVTSNYTSCNCPKLRFCILFSSKHGIVVFCYVTYINFFNNYISKVVWKLSKTFLYAIHTMQSIAYLHTMFLDTQVSIAPTHVSP